jgi:hypothetical protein
VLDQDREKMKFTILLSAIYIAPNIWPCNITIFVEECNIHCTRRDNHSIGVDEEVICDLPITDVMLLTFEPFVSGV